MIKVYCDRCGDEITTKKTGEEIPFHGLLVLAEGEEARKVQLDKQCMNELKDWFKTDKERKSR